MRQQQPKHSLTSMQPLIASEMVWRCARYQARSTAQAEAGATDRMTWPGGSKLLGQVAACCLDVIRTMARLKQLAAQDWIRSHRSC